MRTILMDQIKGKKDVKKIEKLIQEQVDQINLEKSKKVMVDEMNEYNQRNSEMKAKYKEAWKVQTQIKQVREGEEVSAGMQELSLNVE